MSTNEIKVWRIHLKTGNNRDTLFSYCLFSTTQYLTIGWHYVYTSENCFNNYTEYYQSVYEKEKARKHRINHALNVFRDASVNDLFWTRDNKGYYWICRVLDTASPHYDEELDIGAQIPVEAYRVGLEIAGQIKASFSRSRGGVCEDIKSSVLINYSKSVYNRVSKTEHYIVEKTKQDVLDNLPDFDLEELVIAFLQIKENYYLLSNSIANKSTTPLIECELISRDLDMPRKAVVQVKGGNQKEIDALWYLDYINNGNLVYLYAPYIKNADKLK